MRRCDWLTHGRLERAAGRPRIVYAVCSIASKSGIPAPLPPFLARSGRKVRGPLSPRERSGDLLARVWNDSRSFTETPPAAIQRRNLLLISRLVVPILLGWRNRQLCYLVEKIDDINPANHRVISYKPEDWRVFQHYSLHDSTLN